MQSLRTHVGDDFDGVPLAGGEPSGGIPLAVGSTVRAVSLPPSSANCSSFAQGLSDAASPHRDFASPHDLASDEHRDAGGHRSGVHPDADGSRPLPGLLRPSFRFSPSFAFHDPFQHLQCVSGLLELDGVRDDPPDVGGSCLPELSGLARPGWAVVPPRRALRRTRGSVSGSCPALRVTPGGLALSASRRLSGAAIPRESLPRLTAWR